MAQRRIVLTGLGTINPLGHNVRRFWTDLLDGKSGIRRIARYVPCQTPYRLMASMAYWEQVGVKRQLRGRRGEISS